MSEFIKNTFRGKTSFFDTLVFFGVFGISFLIMALFILGNKYPYFLVTHTFFIYLALFFIATYTIFLVLSLHRSGKNKKLTYTSISTGVILVSLLTFNFLSNVYNPNKVFESSILSLNSKLPIMIDRDTRFNKVTIEDGNICYNYTIINSSHKKISKDLFTLMVTDKIQKANPIDRLILKVSNKKRKIQYIFKDKDENLITEVTIGSQAPSF